MSFELKGVIQVIEETQQVTDKFAKREFVVNTGGDYPDEIKLQFVQDDCKKLDGISVGSHVLVSFNIRGRSYPKKDGSGINYFTNLQAWKIKTVVEGEAQPPQESNGDLDVVPF